MDGIKVMMSVDELVDEGMNEVKEILLSIISCVWNQSIRSYSLFCLCPFYFSHVCPLCSTLDGQTALLSR